MKKYVSKYVSIRGFLSLLSVLAVITIKDVFWGLTTSQVDEGSLLNSYIQTLRIESPNTSSSKEQGSSEKKDNSFSNEHVRCNAAASDRRFLMEHDIRVKIGRGMNLINEFSGCDMAVWSYKRYCYTKATPRNETRTKILADPSDAIKIQPNDTVYLALPDRKSFVRDFLPHIKADIVLISMDLLLFRGRILKRTKMKKDAAALLNSSHVLHWFMNDIPRYSGGFQDHPKVSPFPLGFRPDRPKAAADLKNDAFLPGPYFRERFLLSLELPNKTNPVFLSPTSKANNPERENIPSGPKTSIPQYLKNMAESWFVTSPNGDHPECHRHYEAIGLGTVPITQLDPRYYRHLKGSVIYENKNWTLEHLNSFQPGQPTANQNMAFEEYWMAYIENTVGRSLRWWDKLGLKACQLHDFELGNVSEVMHNILGREFYVNSSSFMPLHCVQVITNKK